MASHRNDACWCGSGAKFKKCHMRRREEQQPSVNEELTAFREARRHELCLHPEASIERCSEKIINAHSIQHGRQLKRLAREGKVYGPPYDFMDLENAGGKFRYKLVPTRNASTFRGFCGIHDAETFRPIETEQVIFSPEQCFLFGYRATCLELHSKSGAVEHLKTMSRMDAGMPVEMQRLLQRQLSQMRLGMEQGLADILNRKLKQDSCLLAKDYSQDNFYVIEFDTHPELMCCGAKTPTEDFHGKQIQSLSLINKAVDSVTLNIIATQSGGAAILTWPSSGNGAAEAFISSLDSLPNTRKPQALVRLALTIENCFFSPTWWESLSPSTQDSLASQMLEAVDVSRPFATLTDDGRRDVAWNVTRCFAPTAAS